MPSEQLVLCEVFSLPLSLPLPVQLFHGWPISCCSCPGSMCSLLAGSRNWNLNQLENQLVTNFWPFSILTHGLPPPHVFYTLWKYPFWYGVASPKFKHMSLPQSLPFDWCRNVTKAETQLWTPTHPPVPPIWFLWGKIFSCQGKSMPIAFLAARETMSPWKDVWGCYYMCLVSTNMCTVQVHVQIYIYSCA